MNPFTWVAAGALASTLVVGPSDTVRCTQAALQSGARVETCLVVRGHRVRDTPFLPRSDRFHELTVVLKQDGQTHLLARIAGWQHDIGSWGGTWQALPVAADGADSILLLEVVSRMHRGDPSVMLMGRLVPLGRRAPHAEWLPIEVMKTMWIVNVAAGESRENFDDVLARFEGPRLRVVLRKGGDVMIDVVIDPMRQAAHELQGLAVTAEWDRGAPLATMDPSLGHRPPPAEQAPPPGAAPRCTECP